MRGISDRPENKPSSLNADGSGGRVQMSIASPAKMKSGYAKVADLVHHSAHFGITAGTVSINMAAVRQRKREMVDGLIRIHLDKYKATGVQLLMGIAKLVAPAPLRFN